MITNMQQLLVVILAYIAVYIIVPSKCFQCKGRGYTWMKWHEHSYLHYKCRDCEGYGCHNEVYKYIKSKFLKPCQKCSGTGQVLTKFHGGYGAYIDNGTCPECDGRGMK